MITTPDRTDRWVPADIPAMLRRRVVDANDGIVATAGIVEGFAGAGASGATATVAALAAMVAGGIALGGARYNEAAVERDAALAVIEEERRQLALLPDDELTELAALYEAKGLSPRLAREVAVALSERDALAAHVDVEHGLAVDGVPTPPMVTATLAGLAFALGSAVPLLSVLLAPDAWRVAVIFVTVVLSLCVTSAIAARAGHTSVGRTAARTVTVGVATMLLTLAGGSLIDL